MISHIYAYTKAEIAQNIKKNSPVPNFAYEAAVKTQLFIGNTSNNDSGTITFSPPNCMKVELKNAKMILSGCGDTIWTIMPDGSVTRTIGKKTPMAAGMGNMGSYSAPDLNEILKNQDFSIKESDEKSVTIEITQKMNGQAIPVRLLVSTRTWLLLKMSIDTGPAGMVEIGYHYEMFNGIPFAKQINMVMGAMGFMKIEYTSLKAMKKLPRKAFRAF
jgi:outer membrane lipoprotein-sorting protein